MYRGALIMDEEIRWVLRMLSERRISARSADRILRALELLAKSEKDSAIDALETSLAPDKRSPSAGDGEAAAKAEQISRKNGKPKSHILPLVLSAIYCGLGQVYMGKMLKGIGFITTYTLLIVPLFFPPHSTLLHSLQFFFLPVMWLIGVADTLMDRDTYVKGRRRLFWHRLSDVLAGIAISGAVIILVVILAQALSATDKASSIGVKSITTPVRRSKHAEHKEDMETGAKSGDEGASIITYSPTPSMESGDLINGRSQLKGSSEAQQKADDEGIAVTVYNLGPPPADGYPNIAMASYSLTPTNAEPGGTLRIDYTIDSSESAALILGFSVQKVGTSAWVSDPSNDVVVNVDQGRGEYSREFVLPSTLDAGEYNVRWGLWNLDYSVTCDCEQSSKTLTVGTPPIAKHRADDPELISIQIASLRDMESAAKLCYELLSKGYPARIEYPDSAEGRSYDVLIGEFRNEKDAIRLLREMRELRGISPVIVRHPASGRKIDE